jgi:hypothetical protein
MGASQTHYFKDGKKHTGGYHKMSDGKLHSGKTHTASSKRLYHYGQLPSAASKKAARKRT